MPRRKTPFIQGHFYHIYGRGNNKQQVFFEKDDYLFFLHRLKKYLPPPLIRLHAYCLMPNHYHMLVEIRNPCDFSHLMQNFLISITKSTNKKYERVGHLFQGQFGGKVVDTKEYMLTLSRYIHTNPFFAGLSEFHTEWRYSSYRDYLGLRSGSFVYCDGILSHFRDRREYAEFVEGYSRKESEDFRSAGDFGSRS